MSNHRRGCSPLFPSNASHQAFIATHLDCPSSLQESDQNTSQPESWHGVDDKPGSCTPAGNCEMRKSVSRGERTMRKQTKGASSQRHSLGQSVETRLVFQVESCAGKHCVTKTCPYYLSAFALHTHVRNRVPRQTTRCPSVSPYWGSTRKSAHRVPNQNLRQEIQTRHRCGLIPNHSG